MKKVLIVTYYWPPMGGAGVQRWLKFVKYLPEFGWQPSVVTPENPSFVNRDETLLQEVSPTVEVVKLPIWEPYSLFGKVKRKEKIEEKDVDIVKTRSILDKIALWIRGNFFIPDPRKFWVKPTVLFLENYIAREGIGMVITTGPPHSMHLIGLRLKRKTGIKWVADFRDPWSEWDIFDSFLMTKPARWWNRRLEKRVLQNADCSVAIGWVFAENLKRLGAKRAEVITNGFDPDDFDKAKVKPGGGTGKYIVRHIGTIDEFRNPMPFLHAVEKAIREGLIKQDDLCIEFYGNVRHNLLEEIQSNEIISRVVSFKGYIPHHEVFALYAGADLLLLVLAHTHNARHNIPGKLFEYLAAGCTVLAIGDPMGDTSKILREAGAGKVVSWNDQEGLKIQLVNNMKEPDRSGSKKEEIAMYSRKNLTKILAGLLDGL